MRDGSARLRFRGDLARLARRVDVAGEAVVPVDPIRSAKDAVESCGVPHTEVARLLVNGRRAGFDAPVGPGDRVEVFPLDPGAPADELVRPAPLEPRFLLDVHLGRLTELLRLLGFDAGYRNDSDDDALAAAAAGERRWLLTRDRGLLMRRAVTHGYLLRADRPREQLLEISRRFHLAGSVRPFSRCARCNGLLATVEKAAVEAELEPGTRAAFDTFARCGGCGRVYWRGSHAAELEAIVAAVRRAG